LAREPCEQRGWSRYQEFGEAEAGTAGADGRAGAGIDDEELEPAGCGNPGRRVPLGTSHH
jgi:hypothetical protein